MSTEEVAARLGIHHNSVLRIFQRGDLKGVKLNARLLRFRPEDVDAYIAGGLTGGGRAA